MRNLKRALSLTLASVMLLGMMVVGSSAAAGYDDVADTDNVEAIEVLQAVEVMVGDERGFGPERPVNRAEMAVVMGKLLNLDYNYYEATCPFNDVYDWARGWVGACYANGIVSGRGEGVYDPGTTVTAVEAASMLMRALGYFKYQSDYASGFEVSTVLQANKIRLFDGVNSKTNEPLTRNQVAQMALNALKSGMVEPDGNALNFIDANGNVIATGGKVNYVFVTSNKTFATAISSVKASSMGSSNDSPIVELGEQLYDGKLKLTDTTDDFERPSRYWEYDAKAIGTYVKEELIRQEYTVKVTGRTLHDLLGSTTIKDYDLVVAIDGVDDSDVNTHVFNKSAMVRTNENGVGATGKGVLTQVFVDPDEGANGLITIAIINTYLAIAEEDFDDRTDDVDFRVYGIEPIPNYRNEYWKTANISNSKPTDESSIFKLETEDFPEIVDVKENDATLVTVAKGEVQTMAAPEILSGVQISSFKQADWIVSGGTQYDFASAAEFEMDTLYDYTATDNAVVNLKDINYNIYLDKYGYAVGVEEVDRVDNYMFITGVDTNTVNRYAVQADASAIFLDGTMEAVKIDMKAARDLVDQSTYQALVGTDAEITENIKGGSLINKWFTYTVGNDGVYEVVLVGDDAAVDKGARAGQFRTLTEKDASIPDGTGFAALGTASHGVDKIGPKSIALRGADTPNSTWYSVYGDDQSVYITAELETIQDANGSDKYHVNIISGVDNVAVGIDEADIEVWDKNTALAKGTTSMNPVATAYGSYVLFDDDGDIIGAVVVGEDAGTVTNLVYTHKSKIESETDNNAGSSRANSTKGDYTWTRKVVSNGEEVTLTEVGSGLSKLKSMLPNTWYVVKYNAKGEVKNVYPAWDTAKYAYGYKGLIDAQPTDPALEEKTRTEDQYVNNIEELNTATNENSMVLFEVGKYNTGKTTPVSSIVRNDYDAKAVGDVNWLGGDSTPTDVRMSGKPYVDNHTLYITTQTNTGVHRGFRVADDVKTVFIQTNNREETTVFESGYSRLEKVIDRLHDHAEYGNWAGVYAYHYEISAVMNNGKATVVVIRDLNNAGANFTYDRNRELRLYGNLFTSPTTVTGASNAVVTVGNEEVKPTGIGTDRYGSYTAYSIPQGSIVGIVDYDIDNVDPRFDYMTNMVYSDLNVRYLNRTITFTMPAYDAWIDGGRLGTFVDTIYGTLDSVVTGVTATFDGHASGVKYDKVYNTGMTVVISGLKADTKYEVSIGDPAVVDNYLSDADGKITFSYLVTGADMRTGSVAIHSVKPTDGTVDPKPPIDPDKKDAEVTVTSGLVNIKKDGKVISKITADFKMDTKDMGVKTGDVLTIEPADALKVTGADKNADGTFTVKETTVTISPADGYNWHPLFRQYIDKDGNPTLVEWVSALAVNSVNPIAKRFSLTRAAADDLVDEDKGESKIDTSKLNWFYEAYTAGVRNFEFRTRLADGTVFVENVAIEGTKITVTYDQTKFTPAQYAEYLGVLDANVNDVVTVNPGTDTPAPVTGKIFAKVTPNNTNTWPATFEEYIPGEAAEEGVNALTQEEVAKALNEALKAEGKTVTASKVDLAKGQVVCDDGKTTITFDKKVEPTQVYRITYNNGTKEVYTSIAKDVEDVADGVKYLINKTEAVSSTVIDVNKGKATLPAPTKDVDYAEAVKLDTVTDQKIASGNITDWAGNNYLVAWTKNANNNLVTLDQATTGYVQVGTVITLTKSTDLTGADALKAGEGVELYVNGGKTPALVFTADDKGEFASKTYTVTNKVTKDGVLTLKAVKKDVTGEVEVFLDGNKMVTSKVNDVDSVTLTGLGEGANKYIIAYKDTEGKYVAITSQPAATGDGNPTVTLDSVKQGKDPDDASKIYLYKTYSVAEEGTNWIGYTAWTKADGLEDENKIGDSYLVPAFPKDSKESTIYVVGKAQTILQEKGAKKEMPGTRVQDPTVTGTTKGIWAYEVKGTVAEDAFEPLVTFDGSAPGVQIAASIGESKTVKVDIGHIAIAPADATVELGSVRFAATAGGTLKSGDLTYNLVRKTSDKTKLVMEITAGADGYKMPVAADNTAGELIFTVGGVEVRATVKLAAESTAEKNARVAAALEELSPITIKEGNTHYTNSSIVEAFKALTEYSTINAANSGVIQGSSIAVDSNTTSVEAVNGTESAPNGTKGKFTLTVPCGTGDDAATATVVINVTPKTYAEVQAAALAAAKTAVGDDGANVDGVTVANKTDFDVADAVTAIKSKVETLIDNSEITVGVTVGTVTKYVAEDTNAGTPETPSTANTVVITLSIDGASDVTINVAKVAVGQTI